MPCSGTDALALSTWSLPNPWTWSGTRARVTPPHSSDTVSGTRDLPSAVRRIKTSTIGWNSDDRVATLSLLEFRREYCCVVTLSL